jgi:pimeloyl-ACP methyl ester carboxylesterase
VQEKKIQLASGELTYFRAGKGRPLLYLHPAGGVRRSRVLDGLARSLALYIPVIPGFEGTALHETIRSRRQLAALVADFIHEVIGARCDAMGWSFGGAVALWLALEYAQLVERLVLECPAGLVGIDRKIKRVNRAVLEHYGAEDGKDEGLLARVSEIRHSTLIVQGTDDRTIPAQSAELLRARLKNARLVRVPGAGHDLEIDDPERVLAAVRDFLEANGGNIPP